MNNESIQISKYQCLIINISYQWVILWLLLIVVSCVSNNEQKNQTGALSAIKGTIYKRFPIKRGINISHWLSQNPEQGSIRSQIFTEVDVKFLSKLGYDHLRIPFDEEHLWDEKGIKQIEAFRLLHNAIGWCIKNNLRVILDLHQIRSHSFNNKKNRLWESLQEKQHFVQLWMQLSGEFKKYPVDDVAYELLNEAVADSSKDWNELVAITLNALRKAEPTRKIIIGSNRWQSPNTFDELVIPGNDKNIILSFHFYTPHIFTHYLTHWSKFAKYTGPVRYPGQTVDEENLINYDKELVEEINIYNGYYTKDSLLHRLQKPIEYAKKHGLQLYCGEFGCTPFVRRNDRLTWYRDVKDIFETNNIAWSNWDYKGAFSIFNLESGNPDEKLISVLLGTSTE